MQEFVIKFVWSGDIAVTQSLSCMKLAVILVYEPEMDMIGLIPRLGLKDDSSF